MHFSVVLVLTSLLCALIGIFLIDPTSYFTNKVVQCIQSFTDDDVLCRAVCMNHSFSLYGMKTCLPRLTCIQINDEVTKGKFLGQGAVKMVYLSVWNGYNVTLNIPNKELNYTEDYQHGVEMIHTLQSNQGFITQLLGVCDDKIITEYYRHGTAINFHKILQQFLPQSKHLRLAMQLCVDYVKILDFLHSYGNKTYVMCDSNDLEKTLQQYLITDDLHLVLNDVDSLAIIDHTSNNASLIKCGHHELAGDFVAPEQLWPLEDQAFVDYDMPSYNEKVDIWKIPDVCSYFLDNYSGVSSLKLQLLDIHMQCKHNDPQYRPSASKVVEEYRNVIQTYFKETVK